MVIGKFVSGYQEIIMIRTEHEVLTTNTPITHNTQIKTVYCQVVRFSYTF